MYSRWPSKERFILVDKWHTSSSSVHLRNRLCHYYDRNIIRRGQITKLGHASHPTTSPRSGNVGITFLVLIYSQTPAKILLSNVNVATNKPDISKDRRSGIYNSLYLCGVKGLNITRSLCPLLSLSHCFVYTPKYIIITQFYPYVSGLVQLSTSEWCRSKLRVSNYDKRVNIFLVVHRESLWIWAQPMRGCGTM